MNGTNGHSFGSTGIAVKKRGCWHIEGAKHDCGYVESIAKLIEQAEHFANQACTYLIPTSGNEKQIATKMARYDEVWNETFHTRLDELASEQDLRKGSVLFAADDEDPDV